MKALGQSSSTVDTTPGRLKKTETRFPVKAGSNTKASRHHAIAHVNLRFFPCTKQARGYYRSTQSTLRSHFPRDSVMDEALSPTGSSTTGGALRSWIAAALLILLTWNGFQAWRMTLPMKQGHDAFISRQIGRTALNHRVLGVQTTRLANVTAIRQDGGLLIHRSYGPMASWVVALGMAVGLPYDLAVRLPVLVSMNLFLIGTGLLARRLGGPIAALAAMSLAALAPVVLFRYSLLCVFENLGLGPFMLAVGVGLQPGSRARSIAVGALATLAVLFSWIFLAVLVPWLSWDAVRRRRAGSAVLALATMAIPTAVYLASLQAVSGDCLGDVRSFLEHIGQRSSWATLRENDHTVLTPGFMVRLNGVRLIRNVGYIPVAWAILSLLVLVRRRRLDALVWCLGLLAMALSMNFSPNLAYLHDFFVILYVPAIALACGLLAGQIAKRFPERVARRAVLGGLAVFVALDVIPRARIVGPGPEDARQDAIARELGQRIGPRDLVIADPSVCSFEPDHFQVSDANREWPPLPFYAGRICQTVLVARTPEEALRLARDAKRTTTRAVFVINCGATDWRLSEAFSPCPPASPIARFQLWEGTTALTAVSGRGTVPASVRR